MAVPKPGEHITTKCGRCNDITGHIVMLVLDGQVAKVECRACGSVHKYREARTPGTKTRTAPTVRHVRAGESRENAKDVGIPRSTRIGAAGTPRKAAAKPSAAKSAAAWQEAMNRQSGNTPLTYGMGNSYAVGDFLEHPVFGRGEVFSAAAPGKIDVLFEEGVKTLRCKA